MKIKINESDFETYWKQQMRLPANRQAYFASRAWQMRKQALSIRSNGKCERCQNGKYEVTHHLTYAHFGAEYLKELQAICRPCHSYLHARSDFDPANQPQLQLTLDFDPN